MENQNKLVELDEYIRLCNDHIQRQILQKQPLERGIDMLRKKVTIKMVYRHYKKTDTFNK